MSPAYEPPANGRNLSVLPLQTHPVYQLATDLSAYLGIERDWIVFILFLSLCAGKRATPVHLDIVSDQWGLDLSIADRLAAIIPSAVARIDTYKQFHAEEQQRFKNRCVVLARRESPNLYRDIIGFTSRAPGTLPRCPSLWRITQCFYKESPAAPVLRLNASSTERPLDRFASAFASRRGSAPHRRRLAEMINSLGRVTYTCTFQQQLDKRILEAGRTAPSQLEIMVVQRLLQVFTAIRRVLSQHRDNAGPTLHDYAAVRTLLTHLPLVPVDRKTSADALIVAERLFSEVQRDSHQLALPDRSADGHKWFTRNHAVTWTELAYTTIKKHLDALEDDGVLVTTVDRNNRHHGCTIHYRFAKGRSPPFDWRNPFDGLPELFPE